MLCPLTNFPGLVLHQPFLELSAEAKSNACEFSLSVTLFKQPPTPEKEGDLNKKDSRTPKSDMPTGRWGFGISMLDGKIYAAPIGIKLSVFRACLKNPNPSSREAILGKMP